MVYYRKYRPQNLDEIVGQSAVKATLQAAFKENRLSHAYLFCGPRGTGKTSTARILAKMINCENQLTANSSQLTAKQTAAAVSGQRSAVSLPCNECSSCMSITDGSNLDLIEIDAASNRGIDDIRTLRENIKLSPTSSSKKVYIIDEVHMLSAEAFNALLKTLEEPPAHVIFILATTEEHKIPITILSRVQKLDFQLASVKDLMTALKRVVDGEKLDVDEDALRAIAKRSEGSFRDGIKILDQLASKGEKISLDLVETTLNSGSFNELLDMLTILAKHEAKPALDKITQVTDRGVNIKDYALSLTEAIRYLFLIKHGAEEQVKDSLGPARFEKLAKLSQQFTNEQLLRIIKLLQESIEKMKTTFMPVLALEVALVEACEQTTDYRLQTTAKNPENVIPHSGIFDLVSPPIQDLPNPVIASVPAKQSNIGEPVIPKRSSEGSQDFLSYDKTALTDDVVIDLSNLPPTNQLTNHELTILVDKWTYILETVKSMNFSLEAMLRSVKLSGCDDNIVSLEVPYSFHQRILESPKNRDLLESVLSDVLSKSVHIATILGERPATVEDVANIELAADDEIIRVAAEIFSSDTTLPSTDSPSS